MAGEKVFRALHRYAPVQPRKARLVATLVRGLPVNDALATLKHTPRRAAYLFRKVVRSAMANASNDPEVDLNALVVQDARADMGPLLGGRPRWRPRAMGRATPILKRTSHLFIVLGESAARRTRRAPAAPAQGQEQQEEAAPEAAE